MEQSNTPPTKLKKNCLRVEISHRIFFHVINVFLSLFTDVFGLNPAVGLMLFVGNLGCRQ